MPGLETAFYIFGIVFMGLSLLILVALAVAVLIIRSKVIRLEKTFQDKMASLTQGVGKVVEVAKAVHEVAKAAKK
jgi:hypothetical protein